MTGGRGARTSHPTHRTSDLPVPHGQRPAQTRARRNPGGPLRPPGPPPSATGHSTTSLRPREALYSPSRAQSRGPAPRWFSQRATARLLGISRRTLRRLGEAQPLFRPARRGIATGTVLGKRLVGYHVRQIELIELVMLNAVPMDEAELRWALFMAEARARLSCLKEGE